MANSGLNEEGGLLRGLAEAQAEAANGRGLPPVERWNPPFCGTIDMRITRDGTWTYLGTPIRRPALVRLFSTILRREEDGSYVLVTPVERVGITVEDAPFLAVRAERLLDGKGPRITFLTNVGDMVIADKAHPIRVVTDARTGEPRPYVHVRKGLEALIARPVFYDLVAWGTEAQSPQGPILTVESEGVAFSLGLL
ncbi:MAG: DUF1285 domain-containing protein [Alphaproteobacteria bacterium]|nr:DUF1285 domain-containing protein [Alphaproteobacteria bacterium]